MILRDEMILSDLTYERKKISFIEKNSKLTKSNTFNDVFCNKTFPYYRFLPIFQKCLDLHKLCFICLGKIFSKSLRFLILKTIFKCRLKKKMFL